MDTLQVVNEYGEVATHEDCLDNHEGNCSGGMVDYFTVSGTHIIRCVKHTQDNDSRNGTQNIL